jgi:hypothetical protein
MVCKIRLGLNDCALNKFTSSRSIAKILYILSRNILIVQMRFLQSYISVHAILLLFVVELCHADSIGF